MDQVVLLSEMFKNATEGIVVSDRQGNIILTNPRAERMLGYKQGDLLGKKIESLVPDKVKKQHISHRENYHHHPQNRSMGFGMILTAKLKSGQELPVEVSLSSFEYDGERYVISFMVDITKRKEQQEALNKAHEQLKVLNEELENKVQERTQMLAGAIHELEYANKNLKSAEKEIRKSLDKEKELNELKSRFVTTASHEFRTPLATILSSVTLVDKYSKQEDEPKRKKHIERIKSAVNNLREILNDFLSISKLEEGSVNTNTTEFNLNQFVKEITDEMQSILKSGQKISYVFKGDEMVKIDAQVLRNIIINLISNAVKYSSEGQMIDITISNAGGIELLVKDYGIGIPDEDQQHLFKRFFRAKNSANIQGTGLGLNIIQKYVELLNGQIGFKSEEGKGSEFMVKIPID